MEYVELSRLDPDRLEPRALAEAASVIESARRVDCPHELSRTVASYAAHLQHGWDGEPPTAYLSRDANGRVVGVLEVYLPRRDNTHMGYLEPIVDPSARCRGVGRALYEAGVEILRSEGRTLVLVEGFDNPHSLAFAEAIGADRAIESVKRRQTLRTLDQARLAREYEAAERAAADYELVRMPSTVPDDLMPDVVQMVAAINDAPLEALELEDEVFTPERIRAFEAAQAAHRRRLYRVAARHRSSGRLAGHTVVGVESDRPWHAGQFDTSVLADHRGHRLGVLLKIEMLRWLAEEEPQLHEIETWNAASNAHMIGVNEVLGYEVVATATGFQRHI